MSILTLNNGEEVAVLETSTPDSINVRGDLPTVSHDIGAINADTMDGADLAGAKITGKIYVGFNGTREDGGEYAVTISFRDRTDMELLRERLSAVEDSQEEQNEAIDYLLMGGESEVE